MDSGAATFFLGDVVSVVQGEPGQLMTSEYFRANISEERKNQYEARLQAAQIALAPLSLALDPARVWRGPSTAP
jgi:hypothetical protein